MGGAAWELADKDHDCHDYDYDEDGDGCDVPVTAILLHPPHKNLATVFTPEGIVDVKLVLTTATADTGQVDLVPFPQPSSNDTSDV